MANASATFTVNTVTITRDTAGNSGPGGSGAATKVFVDGNITIASSAVNEVTHAHTFTVTVNGDAGGGLGEQPVAGMKPTVTLAPVPGSVTDNCASTGTDAAGQCTVVINSNVAGTFVANASATFTVNTVTITRDTAGNSGPGGSGAATKVFVDGNITIASSAVNEVTHAHTFTVTVNGDAGGGLGLQPVAGVKPNGDDRAGAGFGDRQLCVNGHGHAAGQCTVVINSNVAGTFVANASATFTVNTVTITRDTAGNSGPGGSGAATKVFVDGNITIASSAVNEVTHAHTFTVTVNGDAGGGLGLQPVAGVKPTVTLAPVPGSVTDNCASTGTDAAGQCTVVINSNVAGTFVANASATFTVNTVTITRDTAGNSGPGGSGAATKVFVDGNITIASSAVNEVTHAHTFTVTVNGDAGGGLGLQPVAGVKPTVTLAPVPGSVTDNCASTGTDAAGQCTVVINSNVAGTFVANASATFTVNTVTITRDTAGNSGPGGSGAATKVFVDGNITIASSAVNEVTHAHTFTVTVNGDAGGGLGLQPVAGVKPTVTLAPVPGSVTDNCASTGTDAAGQCTVVINSNVAGTFVANASATFTVNTVTITRDTAGNSGPGGSGAATKVFVDGNITIASSAVNEVTHAHTFTVTVNGDAGGGLGLQPVAGVKPTVTLAPVPGSVTDNCASTGTDAAGQCTVVINSNVAGTFVANASATFTVNTVTITRDTAGNSGPGGSGAATKVFVDGNITIGPSATNQVGQAHTFTVTVNGDAGGGLGLQPVAGVKPTVTLTPVPSSVTDNCASTGTNAAGQCTVVISSNVAGTFVANASATFTVNTVTITRDTAGNSGPGGSGAATKIFIPITPTQATTKSADGPIGTTTISDTDTVSGAFGAAGASDWSASGCTVRSRLRRTISCAGPPVYSQLGVQLTGGTADTAGQTWTASTTPFTPTTAGFYAWQVTADFTGDQANTNPTPNPTPCTGTGSEIVDITPATPTQATTKSADGPIGTTTISDTDTVSGAFGAAGSSDLVSFRLYGPFATSADISCAGTPVYSELNVAADRGDGQHRRADVDGEYNAVHADQGRPLRLAGDGRLHRRPNNTNPTPNPTPCTGPGSEIVNITPVNPTLSTQQTSPATIQVNTTASVSDTATLSGFVAPAAW